MKALSGIRTTIPVFQRAKTVHALDRAAIVDRLDTQFILISHKSKAWSSRNLYKGKPCIALNHKMV
jgi:hypothetical protein